jgi:putative addiction module component (TIGR02574 family)
MAAPRRASLDIECLFNKFNNLLRIGSLSPEKIAQEAAELTRQERLALVRLLLDFDQPSNDAEIASAWEREIRARVTAVDEGRVSGIPYDTSFALLSFGFCPSRTAIDFPTTGSTASGCPVESSPAPLKWLLCETERD